MEPVGVDRTHILVLNYNGRALLDECLPSVVAAAECSAISCPVSVVDNGSTDGSVEFLLEGWPGIEIWREPNRGLASFNHVLARLDEPVVLLLNNDVKLDPDAVTHLVRAFDDHPDALFTAPLCWDFEGQIYEGMRTRVRTRYGLVQGMCRVPDHEATLAIPDLTAAAGPVLAVDREKFLAIGGYDELYFPGRVEDLDLGFRGWIAGWSGRYVPQAVAFHRGFGSFGPEFGALGCDRLAARNTLIFAWKNLRGARLATHFAWLPVRFARALLTGRTAFAAAVCEAASKIAHVLRARRRLACYGPAWVARQEAFFDQFRW